MMIKKLLFWSFVALDGMALGMLFLIGLAGAQPSHTHPMAVVAFFAVPGLMLAGLAAVFVRAPWPMARNGALLLAALPVLLVPAAALLARGAAWMEGDPVDAWHQPSSYVTPPLVVAIRESHRTGPDPVRALLRAGTDPNGRGIGGPNWFEAITPGTDPGVLPSLLQHEIDLDAVDTGGHDGLYWAAWHRNWDAAAQLVEHGAPVRQVPAELGGSLPQVVDRLLREAPNDAALRRLRAALRAAEGRRGP